MNNDRFKFRAWDEKNKKMHTKFYWNEFISLETGRYAKTGDPDYERETNDDYILMQCTGLKDKNGKLIFEGDILRCDWDDTRYPPHNIGPVYWDEENVCFLLGEGGSPYYDAESFMEVIGNICENQELLLTGDK